MTAPDWTAAHGAITAYPDIPSEVLTGLARGELSRYLQEVHDAGWHIEVDAPSDYGFIAAAISNKVLSYIGQDDATHRVDIMIVRAYLAWKGRET